MKTFVACMLTLTISLSGCGGGSSGGSTSSTANSGNTVSSPGSINVSPPSAPPSSSVSTLFANSVASNSIDFIHTDDPSEFESLVFVNREAKEMPDSRVGASSNPDSLIDQNAYLFEATFTSGKVVGIWVSSQFATQAAAQGYAEKVTEPLGKLPQFMRNNLSHVIIHQGDEGAFAESIANFFVLYSENMDTRISNNDLEETVFHESIHATLDQMYLSSAVWMSAQAGDKGFVTDYAMENFDKEDMAESALFAYTLINHPDRLPDNVKTWLENNNVNRLAFFKTIF